jgi:hypothetical protein
MMKTKRRANWLVLVYLAASCFAGIGLCAVTGCEHKEKVIDVETPGADVEITRDKDTGQVEVETDAPAQ